MRDLQGSRELGDAFPGQSFTASPALETAPDKSFPELYRQVLASLPPGQAVVVVVPDDLHYAVVKAALDCRQHVLCVKPFMPSYAQADELRQQAWEAGLLIGVEYHKRFDRRALIARKDYRLGHFGEFALGEAKLIEPYYYRNSNFQNWFTLERTDPFAYVGCHYVDLVYFITGLRPTEVSVAGVKGRFPNGNEGYLWANGRVRFENNALLSVIAGLGYPDQGAGSNEQCLTMFCEGAGKTGLIKHDDQFRGVTHCQLGDAGCGSALHRFVNPDFFKLIPWDGPGLQPVGYGFDSVAASLTLIQRMNNETAGLKEAAALARRRKIIRATDDAGLLATPANSFVNELVVEAGRRSILADGQPVQIRYDGQPRVELR